MPKYLELANKIDDATLKPGDRLPPQRNFTYERKVAVWTASCVNEATVNSGFAHRRSTCHSVPRLY